MQRLMMFTFTAMLFAATAAPAAAQTRHEAVNYADLDIATERGADALIARLENASRNVCNLPMDNQSHWGRTQSHLCRVEAMERAVRDLHQPIVTARYAQRRGEHAIVAAR